MKIRAILAILLALMLALAGCGSRGNKPSAVDSALQQGMNEAKGTDAVSSEAPDTKTTPGADRIPTSVDIDLTALSSTMVYSEVYNMMAAPNDYIGKTVKMGGLFTYYHDESTDKYYFTCIIQDAAACCAQGIEFVLTDDYSYPNDYPQVNEEICVVGIFDTYQEQGITYCTLKNARLL